MVELIQQLVSSLGVNEDQAQGGAGLMFKFLQEKLNQDDFKSIADAVPGLDGIMGAAPNLGASGGDGGLMGMLGGIASSLGADKLGDLAELGEGFSQLGLSADMIGKFAPAIINYLEQAVGGDIVEVIKKVLL